MSAPLSAYDGDGTSVAARVVATPSRHYLLSEVS
jgi:hypothetical protein